MQDTHLLGVGAGPVQAQGVERVLAPNKEPVPVLVQVERAEAQEASVAKEKDGAVGAQQLCRAGKAASAGATPAPKAPRVLVGATRAPVPGKEPPNCSSQGMGGCWSKGASWCPTMAWGRSSG